MEWTLGSTRISLELGHSDDSDLELAVKSENIPLGLTPGGVLGGGGTIGGFGISISEGTHAENVIFWPAVSIQDPDRRSIIRESVRNALDDAEKNEIRRIGFFTMGLEVSRVPSWEIAEEIAAGIAEHLKMASGLELVLLVVSSATQLSSFQYVMKNLSLL